MQTGGRILVVEDSRTQAIELAETLERAGYQVAVAADGDEALSQMLAERPDVVISDVVMPGMDGYELTSRIRSDPYLRDLPVILVTSMSDPQDVIRGLECGADGFVLKPLDVRYLVGRIQFLLLNRRYSHETEAELGVRVFFNGRQHFITADRIQILSLLLSTYEAAVERNRTLAESQGALEYRTAELQSTNRFLDSVIEYMPSGIFVLDAADGRIIRVNRAAEQLAGAARQALLGRRGADYFPPAESERVDASNRRAFEQRAVLDVPSYEVRALDGELRTVHIRRVPVFDADGEPTHLILMCDDVTARTKAEARLKAVNAELLDKSAQLQKARRVAEAASRAKSDFLAAMSHEIRTPLNGVIGMVDVLHQSRLMPHQVEVVELIRDSAHQLLEIIEDILDFSKIEAGKMTIEQVPVDVAAVVERACGLVDNLASAKAVELTVFVAPEVPARVIGDALRLRQILINLIGNAIKFSSGRTAVPGRVAVRATVEPEDGRSLLALKVSDNGIGMDEATVSRLFREFEQADSSTSRRFGGTGLGLAICARLIELMGGRIEVHSAPGTGSTFTVRLPVQTVADPPVEEDGPASLDGLRCVVVGDRDGLADDHAAYLRHAGAVVGRVSDLPSARRWTERLGGGPVVWVLDLEGYIPPDEVVAAVGRIGAACDVRIVVVAIGRGRRRVPRTNTNGIVTVDGNVLLRRHLVEAVSIAVAARLDAPAAGAWIPERPPAEPAAEPAAAAGVAGPVAVDPGIPARGCDRILVVEDNATNRKVIARQLALLNIPADIVVDGQEALARWRVGDYALVLTDLHMPTVDGFELAVALRADEQGRGVAVGTPIVALSANVASEEVKRCRAAGMDDYLSKPVQVAQLAAMLERWLPANDLDSDVLPGIVGTDPAILAEFLDEFRAVSERLPARIRQACLGSDGPGAADAAHQFKSACRTVGAEPLADACQAIETAGRGGGSDGLTDGLRLFEVRLQRLLKRLAPAPGTGSDPVPPALGAGTDAATAEAPWTEEGR